MDVTNDPRRDRPTSDGLTRDWATDVVDRVVDVVDAVRRVTVEPALTIARGLVYGLVVLACGLAALVLTGLGLFRLLDVVLPGQSWSAHLALGFLCCALGSLFWSRRSR